jgi:hypothetical protein
MILAVPDPQNVQFGPRPLVMSTAMSLRVSCTPITEGAQFLMKLIRTGSRRFQCRLGKGMSATEVLLRQLIDNVRARVIMEPSPAICEARLPAAFAAGLD